MRATLPVPNRRARNVARLQRGSAWVASLLIVALLSACSLATLRGKGAPQGTVALVVENRGYSDVILYVIRSEGARGARVGFVNGGATVTFKVRETDLQAGGQLQLEARAIGARSSWTSPSLSVNSGSVVKLELIAVGTTDLTRSQIYIIQ
jgi:hypothetical protein